MKKCNRAVLISAILSTSLMSGCASIVSSGSQDLTIDSFPQGATVILDGVEVGLTPMTLSVSRKQAHIVVEKDGYDGETISMSQTTNPWFFGNFIIGGVPGSLTDSSTGANLQYDPGQYVVTLEETK